MDNELLALVAILPGIEAAIEKLEAERDLIVGGSASPRSGAPSRCRSCLSQPPRRSPTCD